MGEERADGVGGLWMVAVLPAYAERGKVRGGPMVVPGAGAGLGGGIPAGQMPVIGCWGAG